MTSGDVSSEPGPAVRRRGRPRNADAEDRIVRAALEEYGEYGASGFTIDRVARRAHVGKSSVYLRWPDKETLLADALRASQHSLALPADTGSLRGDVYEMTRQLMRQIREPAGWASYRVVLDSSSHPPEASLFPADVRAEYDRYGEELYARARTRGDLAFVASPGTLFALIYGASIQYVLAMRMEGIDITDEVVDAIADDITACLLDRP